MLAVWLSRYLHAARNLLVYSLIMVQSTESRTVQSSGRGEDYPSHLAIRSMSPIILRCPYGAAAESTGKKDGKKDSRVGLEPTNLIVVGDEIRSN